MQMSRRDVKYFASVRIQLTTLRKALDFCVQMERCSIKVKLFADGFLANVETHCLSLSSSSRIFRLRLVHECRLCKQRTVLRTQCTDWQRIVDEWLHESSERDDYVSPEAIEPKWSEQQECSQTRTKQVHEIIIIANICVFAIALIFLFSLLQDFTIKNWRRPVTWHTDERKCKFRPTDQWKLSIFITIGQRKWIIASEVWLLFGRRQRFFYCITQACSHCFSLHLNNQQVELIDFFSFLFVPSPAPTTSTHMCRGTNGGVIYVNSLGQLSTDKDSGFDEKHSFILRPDKDSIFDQDFRVPSNSFDTLKGVGNSYSFGIPGGILRGSEDLSEPVDPAELRNDRYLPPASSAYTKNVPKQIYTYPNDAAGRRPTSFSPEHTGQINTKLAANSPKFQPPQVYGPAITNFPGSNAEQRPPQQAKGRKVVAAQQQSPIKLYQAPRAPQTSSHQTQQFKPKAVAPAHQQHQQSDRRNFNVEHSRPQQQHQQQQQQQQRRPAQAPTRTASSSSSTSNQSNETFLRNLLKDMTHIHNDKGKLVELIQRLFVPPSTNMRVVSADVIPSQPSESYVFTYHDDHHHTPSEHHNSYTRTHHDKCGGRWAHYIEFMNLKYQERTRARHSWSISFENAEW